MSMALSVATAPTISRPTSGEHDLVAAVRRGDDRAFEELYARYRSRIGAYVLGMVGDHGRAEDITQEIFISALRRMRKTERPIAFKAWIYEIAKNACIDHFRRSRRAEEVSLDDDDGFETPDRGVHALATTPHVAVDRKQQLDDLRGAFGCLSDNHHQILVMRELEGRSYVEIGERLGMSRAVVESTLFRARRRLTDEYEELVTGRRCESVQGILDIGEGASVRSYGIRERRRIARHLSHCQPCRRHARLAGFDESILKTPSVAERIAALLPFPFPFLRGRGGKGSDSGIIAASHSHPVGVLKSVDAVTRLADPVGPSVGAVRAVAAAAALAIAGIGGGLATIGSTPAAHKPPASAAPGPGGGAATGGGSASGAVLGGVAGQLAGGSKSVGASPATGGPGSPRGSSRSPIRDGAPGPSAGGPSAGGPSAGGPSAGGTGTSPATTSPGHAAEKAVTGVGSAAAGVGQDLGSRLPAARGVQLPAAGVPSVPAHPLRQAVTGVTGPLPAVTLSSVVGPPAISAPSLPAPPAIPDPTGVAGSLPQLPVVGKLPVTGGPTSKG